MGQAHSDERSTPPSREELTRELADKFAQKCFTSLELYSFKDVFNGLADRQGPLRYLKEDTIARFLGVPDVLSVSSVLFQMVSYIGAFPFLDDAPAVLGLDQMIMVVTILTDRYRRVLARGAVDRRALLFKSLAVYDRKFSSTATAPGGATMSEGDRPGADHIGADAVSSPGSRWGFAVDEPRDDEDSGPEGDDELVLAALDSLDYINAPKHASPPSSMHGAMIPADNWQKLIMLLLLIAPLDAQESLSSYANRLSGDQLENLRDTANCVLASFLNVELAPGVRFHRFDAVVPTSMPFMFNGLTALFEHFLFSRNLDLHRRLGDRPQPPASPPGLVQPLLEDTVSILNLNVLSQLSFFIPGSSLFRRLRLLYSGDEDGFSMGSFESKVFNWTAPTILLVTGTRLPDEASGMHSGPASAFLATLPPRRFPYGSVGGGNSENLTFGVYLGQPWKHTHRECFGADDTLLFQLQPIHDVFRASTLNKDYASFIKPSASTSVAGISFGCPAPPPTQTYRRSNTISLGPVSLALESSFEFGCFTHNYSSQGGAFQTSVSRKFDFQDRFEISSIEVWGCGGDEEAKHQAEHWAWEAREAEARRKINLGTGDIEADRALLEMAGLIGANRSGGSMG
ncbi:restriction of telomere capping protein 5 [Staphylotrichum tortipilum]|uniref:Restriction of telomere capping protein 5 n=1 Tax=Staphylotrichum tortipilum TaxID=2831512 RepID=A0AAN6RW21_9PEZI|nr:restriction of telomere capping protein 5 [Staphylotrichum longicolle]